MLESGSIRDQPERSTTVGLAWWRWNIQITAAVGLVYFLLAELAFGLYTETNWVAVFWPAFGVSSGTLIALGPRARWPVAVAVIVAILVAHHIAGDPGWLGPTFAVADAAEALVTAGLIHQLLFPVPIIREFASSAG